MSISKGLKRGAEGDVEQGVGDRGGVLQLSQLGPDSVPVHFLLAFTRALIRNNPQRDLISLSMSAAREEVPITPEQQEQFARAVLDETTRSPWPKGFF